MNWNPSRQGIHVLPWLQRRRYASLAALLYPHANLQWATMDSRLETDYLSYRIMQVMPKSLTFEQTTEMIINENNAYKVNVLQLRP